MGLDGEPERAEEFLQVGGEEIEILEKSQDGEMAEDADEEEYFFPPPVPCGRYFQSTEIVNHRGDYYQREKPPVPGAVKDIAGDQEHPVLPAMVEEQVERVNNGEKNREL